jgi:hypothetical protein
MTDEKDLPDHEPLEMVAVAGPAEAQMIEELLNNNSIDCVLQGNVPSQPWPTRSDLDEVRVFVKRADVAQAQELVEGFFTPVAKDELVDAEADLGVDDPDKPSGFTI